MARTPAQPWRRPRSSRSPPSRCPTWGSRRARHERDRTFRFLTLPPDDPMMDWTPERIAEAAGARLLAPPPTANGPTGVAIDSRAVARGDLFVGLGGEHADGGAFAGQALAAGAWGVLATPEHVDAARCAVPGVLLAADDPLHALGRLATAWRREPPTDSQGCQVIGVTGSTGKTSTKDILA